MRFLFALVLLLLTAPAAAGTIMVLGDSLSAAHQIPVASGWVTLLDNELASRDCNTRLVNASISGETTIGGLNRLPKLLETHHPTIVMLELGGNDGLRGFPIKTVKANLREIVSLARNSGAEVLLLGIMIPTNYGRRYAQGFAGLYPDLATELSLERVPFLLEGVAENPQLMQADGVHPTAEAQPMILNNILPYLNPLLECEGENQ
jgi:acyl-CoA thioesterase-1